MRYDDALAEALRALTTQDDPLLYDPPYEENEVLHIIAKSSEIKHMKASFGKTLESASIDLISRIYPDNPPEIDSSSSFFKAASTAGKVGESLFLSFDNGNFNVRGEGTGIESSGQNLSETLDVFTTALQQMIDSRLNAPEIEQVD